MKGLFIPEITAEMFRNGCLESIEALMAEGEIYDIEYSPWIPVSERLPEENETVIASTEYGVYPETRYTKECGWEWAYEAGEDYWVEIEGVTAWMPLPKPYEGGTQHDD